MPVIYFIVVLLFLSMKYLDTSIVINKVVVRMPKERDIGLIFDINVINDNSNKKEMLEFQVHPGGSCCLNITESEMITNIGKIIGGNFGFLEVAGCKTISLIWPTVSLYNRVGFCPIIVTSINANGDESHITHILHFDTRYTTLDPDSHTIRKHKDFTDCHNWDLNYFKNCTPIDCEERYFGQRSYFNCSSQRCEITSRCTEPNKMYDMFANECIDVENFVTENDLDDIRAGKYDENLMEFNCGNRNCNIITNEPNIVINELNNEKNMFDDIAIQKSRHIRQDLLSKQFNFGLPYWLKGLLNGLLIVFATITIYVLICFIIFLIVSWISRRNLNGNHQSRVQCVANNSNTSLPITTSSLMSQRH